MTVELALFLSGEVRIKFGGAPLDDLVSVKAKALLIYLAVTGKAHSRSALAALLWGDKPESAARANLRMALTALRKSIGDWLHTDRHSVNLNSEEELWVDVLVFEKSCRTKNLVPAAIEELREAVALYKGDFLSDYYVPDAPLFEEWITLTRERFRQTASNCLDFLVTWAIESHALSEGINDARRLLSLDPWREESHRHLMILLTQNGQRSAALAQYETCSQILAQELGVEPSQETRQVYQEIRNGDIGEISTQAKPNLQEKPVQTYIENNLPLQTKPFIGRQGEIVRVIQQITSPECNLVTLTGMGGIGKTRLATQIGIELSHQEISLFEHGIFYIPLLEVNSLDQLTSKICETLSLPAISDERQQRQLLDYLREKNLLLILDNFEHLLEASNFLIEILETASKVKLLVTSRAALNLNWEWIFPVTGLTFPTKTVVQSGQGDSFLPEDYPAIQLFSRCARRVYPGFQVQAELDEIMQICQLVDGMPLGIELAAAWVRVIPCADIVAEIKNQEFPLEKEFLATDLGVVPDHQRSIIGVFNYSWDLLPDNARSVLSKLAVFQGGFNRQAAETVAKASLRDLALLTDKSLIQRMPNGRYQLHPLLRQYAIHKIDRGTLARAELAHACYFGSYLQERASQIEEIQSPEILDETLIELPNIRSGWDYLISQIAENQTFVIETMKTYLPTLLYIYLGKSYYQEGARVFGAAEQVMTMRGWEDTLSEKRQILAWIRSYLAAFDFYLGQYDGGKKLLHKSLVVLEESGNTTELAAAHLWLGMIDIRTGAYQEADAYLQKSLTLYQTLGRRIQVANTLNALGVSAYHQGKPNAAEAHYRESLAISRKSGNYRGQANGINNLGSLYVYLGDHEKAIEQYQETLALAKRHDDPLATAMALSNLGSSSRELGRYKESQIYYEESLLRFRALGNKRWISVVLSGLGQTLLALNQFSLAKENIQKGLIIADEIQNLPDILNILYALGCWLIARKRYQNAVVILYFVKMHPACRDLQRIRCQDQLEAVQQSLSLQTMNQAKASAAQLTLDEIIAKALAIN